MSVISKITLPSGTTYDLKDEYARGQIETLQTAVSNRIKYVGKTTTALTDGATTNPITLSGQDGSYTASTGDMVIYEETGDDQTNQHRPKEFIFDGTKWQEFGSTGVLGNLAFKDSATGLYQRVLGVSLTRGEATYYKVYNISAAAPTVHSGEQSYTPTGSISEPEFTGDQLTSTGSYTPEGSVSLSKTNKTATVSPVSGTATYTPEGNVSAPSIRVKTAGSTTTVKNPTSTTVMKSMATAAPGAAAPSNPLTYASVSGETLILNQIGYTTGASITTSNVTVKTGDAAYEATAPTFTGTGVRLQTGNISTADSASFTGTAATVSVTGTPTGDVSTPTFTGNAVIFYTDTVFEVTGATVNEIADNITVS